jgi:enamine deaminase RidA (YjgF/YER057c/UK114 family)
MEDASSKRIVQVDGLSKPKGVWSTAVVAAPGRLLFISGLLAKDESGEIVGIGDISAQTEKVLQNLQKAMKAANGEMKDIVRVDVYVRDIAEFSAIHAVRRRYFPDAPPASTMVQVSAFTDPRALIEINAIAVLP